MSQSTKPSNPIAQKLTQSQRDLLTSAKARKDRAVVIPTKLTGAAASRMAAKLLKLDLVKEIAARGAMPVWRRESDRGFALEITRAGIDALEGAEAGDVEPSRETEVASARADSKIARVIARLVAPDGASLADLVAMTGWLPHTTRAALTGLRRRGFQLVRERGVDTPAVYRIRGMPELAGSAT